EVVDQLGTRNPLWEIFVIARTPASGQIGLRARDRRCEADHCEDHQRGVKSAHRPPSLYRSSIVIKLIYHRGPCGKSTVDSRQSTELLSTVDCQLLTIN